MYSWVGHGPGRIIANNYAVLLRDDTSQLTVVTARLETSRSRNEPSSRPRKRRVVDDGEDLDVSDRDEEDHCTKWSDRLETSNKFTSIGALLSCKKQKKSEVEIVDLSAGSDSDGEADEALSQHGPPASTPGRELIPVVKSSWATNRDKGIGIMVMIEGGEKSLDELPLCIREKVNTLLSYSKDLQIQRHIGICLFCLYRNKKKCYWVRGDRNGLFSCLASTTKRNPCVKICGASKLVVLPLMVKARRNYSPSDPLYWIAESGNQWKPRELWQLRGTGRHRRTLGGT